VAAALVAGLTPALGGSGSTPPARTGTLAQREHTALLDLYAAESELTHARASAAATLARQAAIAREREQVRRRAAIVRKSLRLAHARVGEALRELYIQGQPDPVAIFLGATSLEQAISAIDGVTRASLQNRQLIAELRSTESSLRSLDAALARRERSFAAARALARASVARFQAAVQDRAALVSSLQRQRAISARAAAQLVQQAKAAERQSAKISAPPPAKENPVATTATTAPTKTTTVAPTAPAPPPAGTRTLVVDAVAYHLPGHTASGLPVGVGVIAVDPRVIPLGTRVFVPGYGPAVAADTGSAVIGNIIDLWMPTTAQARAWGRRTVTITIYG
jgi:3D (Asp-Asp-Asp) domain-containing protein